jgi:hypothetical protein
VPCLIPLLPTILLLQFCWKENIRDHKKDIAFLLAWDKESYTEIFLALYMCITIWTHSSPPDLFTTSRSPSHSGLCQFNINLFTLILFLS